MRYLSVCSGIEAATVAWHHMGWEPAGFSEIEKFPSQVLEHHYPDVPKLGDMTKYKEWNIGAIDLLVGGTPCQSFSVAGLRKGLEDPRGNLALVYCGILDHFRPKWFVWENVPGVLSSNGGRDFGSFLGALAQLGYGFAYRVLDAQYFGVAQRRRRVFVVGYLGDWRPAAKVLFESSSLSGNPKPSREKGQETSKCLTQGIAQRYDSETETMIPVGVPDVMATLLSSTAGISRPGNAVTEHETYIPMAPITAQGVAMAQPVAYNIAPGKGVLKDDIHVTPGDITKTLDASGSNPAMHQGGSAVIQSTAVRRLTPVECERLQGFPDGYTDIRPKGKDTPDGPRYKALGNSMAVPVMRWIGERIANVEGS